MLLWWTFGVVLLYYTLISVHNLHVKDLIRVKELIWSDPQYMERTVIFSFALGPHSHMLFPIPSRSSLSSPCTSLPTFIRVLAFICVYPMFIFNYIRLTTPCLLCLLLCFPSIRVYLHLSGSSKQHGMTDECNRYGCVSWVTPQSWVWKLLCPNTICFYWIPAINSRFYTTSVVKGTNI